MSQDERSPGFRPATNFDVPWLLELRIETMSGYIESSGERLSEQDQLERIVQGFESIRILCDDDEDIGMMKLVRYPDVWKLVQIQLLPAHQGRGTGERVLRTVLADAAVMHIPVTLSVLKVNPARRLYERLGFEIVAEKKRSYEMRIET